MMSVRLLLLVCSLGVLSCGHAAFTPADAEETNERTKNIQKAVADVVSMQYSTHWNANSLLLYVKGAQTAVTLENQRKWNLDTWEAKRGMKQANISTSDAYNGSKFVEELTKAVHESVKQLVEVLKKAFEKTPESAAKEESPATWWEYALGNVSAQLEAAKKVCELIEPAKEKMDVAVDLTKDPRWDTMPEDVKTAITNAREALKEPGEKADELTSVTYQAVLTLRQAQELTSELKFPEEKLQEEKLQEKLQVVETLKEELEKKTVDGLKTNGTLELKKAQTIVEAEGNTTANEAGTGVSQDALSVDGGLPVTSHSAALLVSFVLAIVAVAMTAA